MLEFAKNNGNRDYRKRRGERKMRLPDKIAPFLELLHIYRETGSENSESI